MRRPAGERMIRDDKKRRNRNIGSHQDRRERYPHLCIAESHDAATGRMDSSIADLYGKGYCQLAGAAPVR